jgi:TRAP-type mannitol/chloroaromatic compound transport system permease small subunit
MTSEREPPVAASQSPTRDTAFFRTIHMIDAVSTWAGKLFAWITVPMMLGLVIEVITRYGFNHPTTWSYDLTYMLYGSLFMLGAGYALCRKAHIRTDMIYMRLPVRWQGTIDASLYVVFFFPGMIFFLVASWEYFLTSWQQGEIAMGAWNPPLYPFKAVLPLSVAFLLLQGVSELLKSIHAAKRGEWL